MSNFRTIAKKRILNSKTDTLLTVISVAFAASVLFSAIILGASFIEFFFENAERLTGNTLTIVLANAKANAKEIGNYLYEFYRYYNSGYVEPKDRMEVVSGELKEIANPIPLADNADSLFSANASVENLPLTVALISVSALLCVYIALSLIFAVSKRERRSFYATFLASGATHKQVRKCLFYEAVYYSAVSIPAGVILSICELLAVKYAIRRAVAAKLEKVEFEINYNFILLTVMFVLVGALIFLMVWYFTLKAGKKLSVKTVAADVKRTFVTSIGNRVMTEDAKTYKTLGIEFYVAFRNFHNNLGKYLRIILMTFIYIIIAALSAMMFTAMRNFMQFESNIAVSQFTAFSYGSEIYACSVAAMIAMITVISTFNAIFANFNSNEGEYALMRSAGSTVRSIKRTVRIEGYVCNAISFIISFVCAVFVYMIISQVYNRDARVDFGSPYMFWGLFLASMLLLSASVSLVCFFIGRKMKNIDLIGVLKDFIY